MILGSKVETVEAKWNIRFDGNSSRVLVKEGENVEVGQKLVEYRIVSEGTIKAMEILGKKSRQQIDQIKTELVNKTFKKGTVLCESNGWFKKGLVAPEEMEITGIDEFLNLKYKLNKEIVKEILSPVEAKVAKIESDKMSLKFKAWQIMGEGGGEGKVWADGKAKLLSDLRNISYADEGKIVFSNQVDSAFLIKAEVVGVKGVVNVGEVTQELEESNLPLLNINREVYDGLAKKLGEESYRMLLNSKMGRLLTVVK